MIEIDETVEAKFSIGQLVRHKLFDYRGVIFEVDPCFMLSDEWYEDVAKSRPPKDAPWYHVFVDQTEDTTYVAQQNLRRDDSLEQISHPDIELVFSGFLDGVYLLEKKRIQ